MSTPYGVIIQRELRAALRAGRSSSYNPVAFRQ